MRSLMQRYLEMRSMLGSQKGATMVEYALMAALIAAVAVTAVTLAGTNVTAEFNKVAGLLP